MTERRRRILVVDDSEDVREFFTLLLEEAGYSVDTAPNGVAGLAKVRSERPDLVLLDVVMPGMDGFEMLLKLRSDLAPPVPPVILCSGFDVTEEEALRRGAARFVRKPVDPRDLLALVADVLAGRQAGADAIARERAHVGAARQRAYETARKLLQEIDAHQDPGARPHEEVAFEYASGLARYAGVDSVALAMLRDDRLVVVAASEGSALRPGVDLGEMLPPTLAIIETGSSLVLPNPRLHPCFAPLSARLDGIHFFVGVPVLVEKTAVGVLCVIHSDPVEIEPEDLALVRIFSEQLASVLSGWAQGRPAGELPTRFGPGIVGHSLFEQMLDAELRLLDRKGGSMELAIVNLTDLDALRKALADAASPQRICAGVLTEGRVALYKRSSDGEARRQLRETLEALRARAEARVAGVVDLSVAGLSPFTAPDLVRIAKLALDKTLEADVSGLHRLAIVESLDIVESTVPP